ncbi:MAG TPA: hypothetical protein VFW35_03185 [Sphingomicrobium sp.]|nr:hypothetical protein [Sphingomicrobium sp.]
MSHFEFIFSLFGLLLGLSLAEVLGGAVRTLKARSRVRVGLLTPLLGLFVMVNLVSFWMGAWNAKDLIPISYPALLTGLAVTSLYYVGASLTFPDHPDDWTNFDDYYFGHRRQVLGSIWLCNVVVFFLSWSVRGLTPTSLALLVDGVPSLLVLAAIVSGKRIVGVVSLAVLVAFYLLVWVVI